MQPTAPSAETKSLANHALPLNSCRYCADCTFVVARFRSVLLVAGLVGGVHVLVSTGTATADPRARANAHELPKGSSAASGQSSPATTQPEIPDGNLLVSVPPVPNPDALPGLCHAYLKSDERSKGGHQFQVLIGATGENLTATTAWCETYLSLWQEGKTGRQ